MPFKTTKIQRPRVWFQSIQGTSEATWNSNSIGVPEVTPTVLKRVSQVTRKRECVRVRNWITHSRRIAHKSLYWEGGGRPMRRGQGPLIGLNNTHRKQQPTIIGAIFLYHDQFSGCHSFHHFVVGGQFQGFRLRSVGKTCGIIACDTKNRLPRFAMQVDKRWNQFGATSSLSGRFCQSSGCITLDNIVFRNRDVDVSQFTSNRRQRTGKCLFKSCQERRS